jgi:serine/threonine-protein kinase
MGTSWDHESVTELIDPILVRARSRIGTVLREKWRLDVLLGLGGMAAVYAATHRNGSRVAVKVLHTEVSMNPLVRQRFLREGYTANKVEHPGIVTVSDDDVAEDGAAFLIKSWTCLLPRTQRASSIGISNPRTCSSLATGA